MVRRERKERRWEERSGSRTLRKQNGNPGLVYSTSPDSGKGLRLEEMMGPCTVHSLGLVSFPPSSFFFCTKQGLLGYFGY